MDIRRPPMLEHRFITAVSDGAEVIRQRIRPNPNYLVGLDRAQHAPLQVSPREAHVLQTFAQQAENLIATNHRLNAKFAGLDQLLQSILKRAQLEEQVLL